MFHKLMMVGSVATLSPWVGSITYFVGPLLWIRDIAQLKTTRDCYVALRGGTTNNQLLACGWKSDNSALHFYLYSTKPNPSISLVKTLEIKSTQRSSGFEERAFSVVLLFGRREDIRVNRWTLESNKWVEQEGKIFDLTGFCKSTSLSSFSGSGTKALTCKWGEKDGQQETWHAFT